MRDRWLDEHVGGEAIVRPEFEASLGESLQTAWRRPSGSAAARRPTGPSRRTQVLIWSAAAAVLLVGGAVVLTQTGKSSVTSNTVDVTAPATVIAVTTVPSETTIGQTTTAVESTTSVPATTSVSSVVATSPEQQTVLDYLTALADGRYEDAAKLLGEGGLSLEDRSDLRPFLNADGQIPDLALSLRTWCQAALCQVPTALTSVDVPVRVAATFAAGGVERTSMFVPGSFEGSRSVRGLPLQLPAGSSLADTVQCPTRPVEDTAYVDLNGDGWYETATLTDLGTGNGGIIAVCGTTLAVGDLLWPETGADEYTSAALIPLDIEGDGVDEMLAALYPPDDLSAEVLLLRDSTLVLTGRTVTSSNIVGSGGGLSFGCVDLDGDGIRDLVSYTYSFVGGFDISTSTRLDYTASLGNIRTTGSLALPAQVDEAFRLISGYCGNFPTQTG